MCGGNHHLAVERWPQSHPCQLRSNWCWVAPHSHASETKESEVSTCSGPKHSWIGFSSCRAGPDDCGMGHSHTIWPAHCPVLLTHGDISDVHVPIIFSQHGSSLFVAYRISECSQCFQGVLALFNCVQYCQLPCSTDSHHSTQDSTKLREHDSGVVTEVIILGFPDPTVMTLQTSHTPICPWTLVETPPAHPMTHYMLSDYLLINSDRSDHFHSSQISQTSHASHRLAPNIIEVSLASLRGGWESHGLWILFTDILN
jgi:hypothetical protein